MRGVIDTNVWVSAFLAQRGYPAQLIEVEPKQLSTAIGGQMPQLQQESYQQMRKSHEGSDAKPTKKYCEISTPKWVTLYQSPSQSSRIPARAEFPHSLPSPPLSRGERVGVRGDSSPVHPRTLAVQLVLLIE
jgi:hypothetical protein